MKTLQDLLMQAIAEEVKQEIVKEAAAPAGSVASDAVPPVAPIVKTAELEGFSKLAQELRKLAAGPSATETVRDFTSSVKTATKE